MFSISAVTTLIQASQAGARQYSQEPHWPPLLQCYALYLFLCLGYWSDFSESKSDHGTPQLKTLKSSFKANGSPVFTRSSPTPFARFMSLHDLTPAHLSKSQTHLQHPFCIMFYLVFPVSVNATTIPPLFLLLILQSNERLEGFNLPAFLHILGGPLLAREPAKATAQTTSANLNLIMSCTCLKSPPRLPTALRIRSKLLTVGFQDLVPAHLSSSSHASLSLAYGAPGTLASYQVLQHYNCSHLRAFVHCVPLFGTPFFNSSYS